jgi:hypothetical protein
LKNVGDICVTDFSDISDILFGEVVRHATDEKKINLNTRRHVERVVGEMFDDYMTKSMTWTKQFSDFNEHYYVDRLPKFNHDKCELIPAVIEAYDSIADMLGDIVSLPTWYVIHIRISGTAVEMTVGEDARIEQWTQEHGHEYTTTHSGKGW